MSRPRSQPWFHAGRACRWGPAHFLLEGVVKVWPVVVRVPVGGPAPSCCVRAALVPGAVVRLDGAVLCAPCAPRRFGTISGHPETDEICELLPGEQPAASALRRAQHDRGVRPELGDVRSGTTPRGWLGDLPYGLLQTGPSGWRQVKQN